MPESGDEIQNIKSGLMEIADCFVVNKADRSGADTFANNLTKIVHQGLKTIPIFKTIADHNVGIAELCNWITEPLEAINDRKALLLAEKAWKIMQYRKMQNVDRKKLRDEIHEALKRGNFNIYRFADDFLT